MKGRGNGRSRFDFEVIDIGEEVSCKRGLANALDYTQWRNFQKVINRAMMACENRGHRVLDVFAEVSKIVEAEARE